MEISIRNATLEDVETIVLLSKELGYEPTPAEIENKIRKFESSMVEKVFVAEDNDVVGWMHISLVEPLESKAFIEIRGIVVKEEYRNKSIGTKLLDEAEIWAKYNGCSKLRVRTNVKREETRKYYRNRSFISKKTQEVFEKEL